VEEKLRVNENVVNKRAQERCNTAVRGCDKRRTLLYAGELMLSGKLIFKPSNPPSSKERNFRAKILCLHFSFCHAVERIFQSVKRQKQYSYL